MTESDNDTAAWRELTHQVAAVQLHAAELEAARVKVFALAKGAAEAVRHGGYVSEADAIDQAIVDYDALAARGK